MTLEMTMTDPDRGLVEGVRRRDLCAVQLLVSRKFHRLAGLFAALMNQNGAEAEALATQVLRTAQYIIDGYDERDLRFDTWLHKLAVNLWRQGVSRPLAVKPSEQHGLLRLDECTRLCLVLSAYQGLEAREIARILSMSIHEVERALKRARQILARDKWVLHAA